MKPEGTGCRKGTLLFRRPGLGKIWCATYGPSPVTVPGGAGEETEKEGSRLTWTLPWFLPRPTEVTHERDRSSVHLTCYVIVKLELQPKSFFTHLKKNRRHPSSSGNKTFPTCEGLETRIWSFGGTTLFPRPVKITLDYGNHLRRLMTRVQGAETAE